MVAGFAEVIDRELASVSPVGMLPWLRFDRVEPTRWFSLGSIAESMRWMALHRPVEPAAFITSPLLDCRRGPCSGRDYDLGLVRNSQVHTMMTAEAATINSAQINVT